MARYTPDPTKVSATIPVLPKNIYEFIIGEPKAFQRTSKTKGTESHGVMFPLTVAEGDMQGKKLYFNCFQHSEGGISFSKRFQIAACNIDVTADGEAEFDSMFGLEDWSYDTDAKTVGEAWLGLMGNRILADLDVKAGENNQPQQEWVQFLPIKAKP